MELIHKKEIRLRNVFFRFLIQIAVSWILALFLWMLLLFLAIATGFILPANTVESRVSSWLSARDDTYPFSEDEIPAGADYACFSADGTILWTSLSDKSLQHAATLASSADAAENTFSYPYAYRKLIFSNKQTLVLVYPIRATFSSAALRHLFPSAEPFLFLFLLALLLGTLVFFVLHYAKKLESELQVLTYTSEQIRARNLDFEAAPTHIAEFNRVLSSLLLLKASLHHSLEQQWNNEQQKKRQMTALAHDIKTPLTVVKGNAELLFETDLTDEQQSYNTFILENTNQIQKYVTEILEISRPSPAVNTCYMLSDLLEQIKQTTECLCSAKGLCFCLVVGKKIPQKAAFPADFLRRALLNLLDNAIFYSPSHGTVTLNVSQTTPDVSGSAKLCFSVQDEGPGFSADALAHATDEFYRADNSRSCREHFGLGLAITQKFATEQGGSLTLSNAPMGGAVVTLTFPIPTAP